MAADRAPRLALLPRGLEFVAGNPAYQCWQPRCLHSEHEAKSGDHGIPGKIHVWAVFVARLMIAVRGEILGLFVSRATNTAQTWILPGMPWSPDLASCSE